MKIIFTQFISVYTSSGLALYTDSALRILPTLKDTGEKK